MPRNDSVRGRNLKLLQDHGFSPANWLPLPSNRELCPGPLRPADEIARRLMALDSLFTWVAFDAEAAASERIADYQSRNSLMEMLTDDEKAIVGMSREYANEEHSHNIGWKLENMWGLAWVLGFAQIPDHRGGEIPHEISKEIVYQFLPGLDASVSNLLGETEVRTFDDVDQMEDLFYLAHNAARSAQLGESTVPDGFHPMIDAGAIHERRHALSWCLSPGHTWEDTDMST
ncbi:MAG: DUF4272 domain-containing protein [Fuerstiella sp.]